MQEEIESLANMRKHQKAAWWTKDCGVDTEDRWTKRQEPGP